MDKTDEAKELSTVGENELNRLTRKAFSAFNYTHEDLVNYLLN